jgi:hypothetical protein
LHRYSTGCGIELDIKDYSGLFLPRKGEFDTTPCSWFEMNYFCHPQ